MRSRAIVTVGVSDSRIFGPYLARFRDTFRQFGGADYMKIWHREWPPESPPHREVHYAFKVHAVWEAFQRGYTSILYFDCDCWAIAPLEGLWARLERDGHVLVEDANALGKWSSDRSLAAFNMSRDDAMNIRLMCGTCWGVDMTSDRSRRFVKRLREAATRDNFVGTHKSRLPGLHELVHPRQGTEGSMVSDDPRVWGHRSDEVWMSLLAHEMGMPTHVGVEFVGGSTPGPAACVRSGYDLPTPSGAPIVNGVIDDGVDYNA